MTEGNRSVVSRSEKTGTKLSYDRVPIFSPIHRSNNFEQIFRLKIRRTSFVVEINRYERGDNCLSPTGLFAICV